MQNVQGYASKIQAAINYHWNNPVGDDGEPVKLQGQIGNKAASIIFDVSVIGVSFDEASKLAADNEDASVNFMGLDGVRSYVTELTNSGEFNIDQLESSNYTVAAHEFGHLLGYYVDKRHTGPGGDGQLHREDGPRTHAWYGLERGFIMGQGLIPGEEQLRRVHGEELMRVNWGRGFHYNTNINLPAFYPEKVLTNLIH